MQKMIKTILITLIYFSSTSPFIAQSTEPVMADYTSYPLFLSDTVEPNIMIILDNSGSMNHNAYGPAATSGNLVGSSYDTGIKTVSQSSDDSEQRDGDGHNYFSGSNDLDIGRDESASHESMRNGVRFQNIAIEPGAVIKNAYIEFTVHAEYSAGAGDEADIDVAIHGEDSDHAPTFTTTDDDISDRTTTTASATWTIPEWVATDIDTTKQTPDLTAIVQEIVNRAGWDAGNAMGFILSNPVANPASGRRVYSWEYGDSSKAPRLVIEVAQEDSPRYYGYFNPDFFYDNVTDGKFFHKYKKVSYSNVTKQWTVISDLSTINADAPTTKTLSDADIVAEGLWDGNWMNWCTMRRVDVLRKVIMGGKATARTGGGNQTNITAVSDQSNREFVRHYDTTSRAAVTPYDGDFYYGMDGGYIYVDTDADPMDGGEDFTLRVQKEWAYEPEDFVDYDSGDNLGGVLQKYGDKARWGNMEFNNGTGSKESGGTVKHTIGTNMVPLVTDLQLTKSNTWTPLAETYFIATQYFKQMDGNEYGDLDYPNGAAPHANLGDDPYHNGTDYVPCAKAFVILLTDGASTKDRHIPAFLKDFDGDGSDSATTGSDGTNYLDDIALYARTTDLRSDTEGKSDLDGDQNIILYTVYAMGDDDTARSLLKDAARNGGFDDKNGNNRPDGDYTDPPEDRLEWDKNGDALPDTYFEASDGYKLEKALGSAITDILRRAASGTSVSVISSATEGEGNIVQAYFRPSVPTVSSTEDVKWIGSIQSLWIDPYGNMREDTPISDAVGATGDKALDVSHDKIIKFVDVGGETKIEKYIVSEATPYPDLDITIADETVSISDMSAFNPLWEAGAILGARAASDRTIFTYIDDDQTSQITYGEEPFDNIGNVIEFTTANTAIRPYLGVKNDATWSHLGSSHSDRFANIVNFIRGENSGFTGTTLIRNRSVPTNPADEENTLVDWKLGDIVHSTPTIIGKPFENYDLLYSDESYFKYWTAFKNRESVVYAGANDGMIHAFTSWRYNSATQAYVQPAGTTEDIGDELWAYIPQALLPHLKWLPGEDYTHVYFNDLRIKVFEAKILPPGTHYGADTDTEKNWGTFLLAGLNYGGKHIWAEEDFDNDAGTADEERHFYPSYICLDVTDPRNPRLMWERSYSVPATSAPSSENVTDLGLTTSYPSIQKIDEKWFATFGSGPHNYEGTSSSKGHVFVVDLATGIPHQVGGTTTSGVPDQDVARSDWLFETDEDDAFIANSVGLDKNMNYNVDAMYISETYNSGNAVNPDWEGAIYKIRIPYILNDPPTAGGDLIENYGNTLYGNYVDDPNDGTNPWVMTKLFESPAPITAAPTLSVDGADNAWIFFGTGRYLSDTDELDTSQQYIYGIKDPFFNREYLSDPFDAATDYYSNTTINKVITTVSDIKNTDAFRILDTGEMSEDGTTISALSFTDLLDDIEHNYDGWERTQATSGERVIGKPAVLGGIVFTTSFMPNQDICSFGGSSNLYGLYFQTGTAYPKQLFDGSEGLETITLDGASYIKIVDVISLGDGLASSPGLHVGKQDGNKATLVIQGSKGIIETIDVDPPLSIRSGLETWQEQ